MQKRFIGSILIVAACAFPALSFAQTTGSQDTAKTMKPVPGPTLSGVWMALPGHVFGSFDLKDAPSMLPWAETKFKATSRNQDPVWKCYPPGFPRILLVPQPMEIIQTPGRILMLNEYDHTLRHVYMDGREHPKDPDPTWLGHSVGKWDGDTLVIDTVGLTDKTWLDYLGHPHTEELHVVERYRLENSATLRLEILIDDPKTYAKTWTGQEVFKLKPDWEITEHFACDAEDRASPAPITGK